MLKIITYPNKILETKTNNVTHVNGSILKLIEKMRIVMHKNKGVGLSANQIGKNLSIAIIENINDRKSDENIPLFTLINPKIINKSNPYQTTEGCLSLPNQEFKIERFDGIKFYNTNLNNKIIINYADGFFAQVIQHEIDHLNGILLCKNGVKVKQ